MTQPHLGGPRAIGGAGWIGLPYQKRTPTQIVAANRPTRLLSQETMRACEQTSEGSHCTAPKVG